MRTLLLTAAALSSPHAATVRAAQNWGAPRSTSSSVAPGGDRPAVSVDINSFDAVDAPHAYDDLIDDAAREYKLNPAMIKAVMQTESAFNALAVSPVGALGLMQLMPEVAAQLGADDPMDPRQNVMAGAKYLRQLLDQHRGNVSLALASYNAGPGAVAKYRAVPPFKETRDYVRRITTLLADARAND
jgi:soluble lytic murein transglycosylase-like protein